MGEKRNLVVVRAGNNSLHGNWLKGPGSRNWDLHISYFGTRGDPYPEDRDNATISFDRGPKYVGLKSFCETHWTLLNKYSYICLADDDVNANCADWDKYFDAVNMLSPDMAQPALDIRSFFSHEVTLRRNRYKYRSVNFIELMMPTFRVDVLSRYVELFDLNKSSFGLDFIWSDDCVKRGGSLIIVDEVGFLHSRRVGSGSQYAGFTREFTPNMELDEALAKRGVKLFHPKAIYAVDAHGSKITNDRLINRRMFVPRLIRKTKNIMKINQIL